MKVHNQRRNPWIGNVRSSSDSFWKLLLGLCLIPVVSAEEYIPYEEYIMYLNESCLITHINDTTEGVYCDVTFENDHCWPPTEVGQTVTLDCMDKHIPHTVSRACLENGEWESQDYQDAFEQCNKYYPIYFSLVLSCDVVSFVACVVAFIILAISRSLWCTRNYIHWHLITAFGLKYLLQGLIIVLYYFNNFFPKTKAGQIAVVVLPVYFEMSSFFWMFVEGVYLHTLVALAFRFDIDKIKFLWYCALGWGVPMIFCIIYLIVYIASNGEAQTIAQNILIVGPIAAVLVLNSLFLLNIVRILMGKLRESGSDSQLKHYRRTARATLVLVILLGVTYIFPMFIMNLITELPNGALVAIAIANSIVGALQGFLVALIYVFMNSEVKAVLSRKWDRYFNFNPCPRRTNDYHAANTTFSRMDDTSLVTTVHHSHNDSGTNAAKGSPNTNNNQRSTSGLQPLGNGSLPNKTKGENLEMSNTSGEPSSPPPNGAAKEESSPLLAGNVIINANGRTLVHDHEDVAKEQMKKGTDV